MCTSSLFSVTGRFPQEPTPYTECRKIHIVYCVCHRRLLKQLFQDPQLLEQFLVSEVAFFFEDGTNFLKGFQAILFFLGISKVKYLSPHTISQQLFSDHPSVVAFLKGAGIFIDEFRVGRPKTRPPGKSALLPSPLTSFCGVPPGNLNDRKNSHVFLPDNYITKFGQGFTVVKRRGCLQASSLHLPSPYNTTDNIPHRETILKETVFYELNGINCYLKCTDFLTHK